MMMKKWQVTKKTLVMTAVIGSFLIMAAMLFNTFWVSRQTISATNEAVSAVSSFYLEAMADRRAKTITSLIDSDFEQMEKAVDVIANEGIESQNDLRTTIGKICSLLSLSRLALVDEDNIVYTQYTTYTGGSRHEFLSEDALGDRVVRTIYAYGSSKQLCLVIPTENLTLMGKPFKACFIQIDIDDIVDLLAFDDSDGTSFALYSKNGSNLSNTELGPFILSRNILDALEYVMPSEQWNKAVDDFDGQRAGSITFTNGETEETLYYVPIHQTGWEVAVLIRESVIQDRIREISAKTLASGRLQSAFVLIAVLVFATILLVESTLLSKKKLDAEKENSKIFQTMANTDSLTGVKSKHAYAEVEEALDTKIKDGEVKELAVVVCDINGLKYVNDTQGHAAGDQLIRDASELICAYFTDGDIFRIGGDEFVVLLQGEGFETRHEAIRGLNRQAEENIAAGAVVVSIGFAELERLDRCVRDAFERADQMMYERKRELKEMGAKTRDA